jgi:hypothetical protein
MLMTQSESPRPYSYFTVVELDAELAYQSVRLTATNVDDDLLDEISASIQSLEAEITYRAQLIAAKLASV